MSCFVSIRYPEMIRILTDGANYDYETDTLGAITEKAACGTKSPIVVTGRGRSFAIDMVAQEITSFADRHGVDLAFARMKYLAHRLKHDERGGDAQGIMFDLLIAGWSDSEGPKHFYFSTDERFCPGFPALELVEVSAPAVAGGQPTAELMTALCRRAGMQPADDPRFLKEYGAELMELARRRQPGLNIYGGPPAFVIGGHCQLTTITAEGAVTETLRVWPDRVGEKIDPFAGDRASNVVPMLSRQQRRAAERAARKGRSA